MMLHISELSRYEKVYIPEMLEVKKNSLEHYEFIKTIRAGSGFGHILHCGDDFIMCLRRDDKVCVEKRIMEPLGFKRKTIEELEDMAETFNIAYDQEKKRMFSADSKKYVKIVKPIPFDTSVLWHIRMQGKYLINTITGSEIHLGKLKKYVVAETGLNTHLLYSIIKQGVEIRNWCLKGERLDGKTWDEYFDENKHARSNPEYYNIYFERDNITVHLRSLRQAAKDLDVSHETLRRALIEKYDTINGYKIMRP